MTNSALPQAEAPNYQDWTGEMGTRWLANLHGLEKMLSPVGAVLLDHAGYQPGERVLDIGCGGGGTSLAIAGTVAPEGSILGIDISPDLVMAATRRAAAEGIENVRFLCADAGSTVLPDAPYDRIFSRFGSMFFADPVAAFSHLRGQLKPGGRMDLAVWGPAPENPWMYEGMRVVRQHVDMPPPIPRAPGPFAFEEPDYMRAILEKADFSDISITANKGNLPVGGAGTTPQAARDFALNAMAFAQALQDCPPDVQAAAQAGLLALYERHYVPGGGVMMGYTAWLVTATA